MRSSLSVAQRFIDLAREGGNALTPMQLLKLVYIAHGWMLGLYGRPLINESIEAWKYDPVIPDLYHKVKQYGSGAVYKIPSIRLCLAQLDGKEESIIKQVYQKYGHMDGITLSKMTYGKGTPWELTWNSRRNIISNDLIEHHYGELAKKYAA